MIIVRYFMLVLAYHLVTFYKQSPLAFFIGCVLWPYHVVDRFFHPPELHQEMVANGVESLKSYWQTPGATLPPAFLRRRFEALGRELR